METNSFHQDSIKSQANNMTLLQHHLIQHFFLKYGFIKFYKLGEPILGLNIYNFWEFMEWFPKFITCYYYNRVMLEQISSNMILLQAKIEIPPKLSFFRNFFNIEVPKQNPYAMLFPSESFRNFQQIFCENFNLCNIYTNSKN